jgi:hypothetical protein
MTLVDCKTGYAMIGKLFGRATPATDPSRHSLDPERVVSHASRNAGQPRTRTG